MDFEDSSSYFQARIKPVLETSDQNTTILRENNYLYSFFLTRKTKKENMNLFNKSIGIQVYYLFFFQEVVTFLSIMTE